MLFLCQINFAEMPALAPFPTDGLMQIFVASDEMYGCAFPSEGQNGFTIIYHADTGDLAITDPYAGGNEPEYSVLEGELHRSGRPLAFKRQDTVPSPEHYLIAAEFDAIWQHHNDADFGRFDEYYLTLEYSDMYLGGYPRSCNATFDRPTAWQITTKSSCNLAHPRT